MTGNVLVIGNSGVGKSTLINAVLGENKAVTGWGGSGVTGKLEIYDSEEIPFRVIDTIGFEPNLVKEFKAINAVKKWSKEAAKKGDDTQINVIWFCVDGTSRKLFPEAINNLSRATSMWPTVPVIVVITKSYSVPERAENIEMVNNAFAQQKRYGNNLKKIIPVVAETYTIDENAFAAPDGLDELIATTNELMPDGIKAAEIDIYNFTLKQKRFVSQGVVGTATVAAATVGALPNIPIADGLILTPMEIGLVNALSKVYGIKNDEESKRFLNSIVEAGTVSVAARTLISALKAIPGIGILGSALNAVVAGAIVAAIGEASISIFEKIYIGEKSVKDIDWVTKIVESKISKTLVDKVNTAVQTNTIDGKADVKKIVMEIISSLFSKKQ